MNFIIPLFYRLLYMSIIASIIGITIIVLKKLTSKGVSPKYNYLLWIIFIVALIFPSVIQSKFSIYNIIDLSQVQNMYQYPEEYIITSSKAEIVEQKEAQEIDNLEIEQTGQTSKEDIKSLKENVSKVKFSDYLKNIIPYVWFTVMLILLAFYISSYVVFIIKIGKEECTDPRVAEILYNAKVNLKIKKDFKLIKQNYIKSPALIGIFNPKILVVDGIQNFSDKNLDYIFRHELAHYKRKDNVVTTFLAVVKIIYWFNPIIWVIIKLIRKDMELAADEIAVRNLNSNERKEYCKLLVHLTSIYNVGFAEKALGIVDDKTNLEKRINMVKMTDKISEHPVISAILVFLIIGLVCLIFYTNNYYEKDLKEPPTLIIKTGDGTEKEMVLTKAFWVYKNNYNNSDINFDANTYGFDNSNTIIIPATGSEVTIDFKPKFKTKILHDYIYKLEGGKFNLFSNANTLNVENYYYRELYLQNGVYVYTISVCDSRNNRADYAVRVVAINGDVSVLQNLLNSKLNETEKVEKILNAITISNYLQNYEISGNNLKLTYKYFPGDESLNGMSAMLFSTIDDLENIEFSFEHQKFAALKYVDDEKTQRERVNFEILEPIIKNRNKVLEDKVDEIKIFKGE